MDTAPERSTSEAASLPSRWARAISGGDDGRAALLELAASYWYCLYAWWRCAGFDADSAAGATQSCFGRWLDEAPPRAEDSGGGRMREWLLARLGEIAAQEVKIDGAAVVGIDPAWAARRFADEPAGDPGTIFGRRWALTVLEFTATALREEYAARGDETLFEELLPFAGFEPGGDERYASAARRTGRTTGAMRKAVFDFRTRQGELLRTFVADTVADPADAASELTALLCAVDAAGVVMTPLGGAEGSPLPASSEAPLPSALRAIRPDEVFARAMQSVRMSSVGPGGWMPPTVAEAARLFPQYEVVSLLGRGGMGAVYKGRQAALERFVAIKLLPLEVSVDEEYAGRFVREARAMASLSHPNIIGVHDFGTTAEGHLYFVMEFIEGANLHEFIHGGGMAPEEILNIMAGVCDALSYAHARGVVHRDIKPANVMLSIEGTAKVADFGLVRVIGSGAQAGQTVAGTVMGTPDYMAPEQKRGMVVDQRADIYSLGVMLYEMLCKETPQGLFEPASKRCGFDKRIDAVIGRALAPQPANRFQNAAEMKSALEPIRAAAINRQRLAQVAAVRAVAPPAPAVTAHAGGRRVPAAGGAAPPGSGAFRKRRPLFLALGAVAVLAAALGVMSLLSRPKLPANRPEVTGFEQAAARAARANSPVAVASKDAPFVNSLGMKFVPVPIGGGPTAGQRVLFGVWDVRVQDYAAYAAAQEAAGKKVNDWWKTVNKDGVPVGREPDHPVVNVSWEDAQAFCRWLTAKETAEGRLPVGVRYRLPSDEEWSWAVGLPPEVGGTPEEKHGKNNVDFPWGREWPPVKKVGNYADESFHAKFPVKRNEKENRDENPWMKDYTDGFATTSPVGSFPANAQGLYDMGGNVWQWCEDWWNKEQTSRVLRGASWSDFDRGHLRLSFRHHTAPGTRYNFNGFRIVVAGSSSAR